MIENDVQISDQHIVETFGDIDETLKMRGNRYGEFSEHARITQNIKRAMQDSPNWTALSDDKKESLEMLAHKIGRILNGDPEYQDSWHDIIGYTKLVEDVLAAKQDQANANTAEKPSAYNIGREIIGVYLDARDPPNGSDERPALLASFSAAFDDDKIVPGEKYHVSYVGEQSMTIVVDHQSKPIFFANRSLTFSTEDREILKEHERYYQ